MTAKIDPLDETEAGDDPSTPGKASVPELDGTLAPETAGTERQELGGLNGLAKIGRYVCLARLGEGGMGVVIAAYDPKLDRKVAIKLIHILRRDDGERRRRMEREAQAMARLSHPNVVTVYEVGEYRGQLFLAMEFVKGRDLRGWLAQREGPADWRATLAVFIQAGHGLAAAHRVGLVHRDFKPKSECPSQTLPLPPSGRILADRGDLRGAVCRVMPRHAAVLATDWQRQARCRTLR